MGRTAQDKLEEAQSLLKQAAVFAKVDGMGSAGRELKRQAVKKVRQAIRQMNRKPNRT